VKDSGVILKNEDEEEDGGVALKTTAYALHYRPKGKS